MYNGSRAYPNEMSEGGDRREPKTKIKIKIKLELKLEPEAEMEMEPAGDEPLLSSAGGDADRGSRAGR